MNGLINTLLEYVRGNGLESRCLQGIPGYRSAAVQIESRLEDLQGALSPNQQDLLERYLEVERAIDRAEEQAMFHCGLTIGLELAFFTLP